MYISTNVNCIIFSSSIYVPSGDKISYVFAVNYIPVGTAQAVHYSGKMTISVLLFWIYKNEKLSPSRGFSVVICIAGCILMIQPPPLFSEDLSTMKVEARGLDIEVDLLHSSQHQRHNHHHKFQVNKIKDETNGNNTITATKNKTIDDIITNIVPIEPSPTTAQYPETKSKPDVALTYGNAMIGITLTLLSSLFSSLQYFLQRTTILKEVPTAPLTWWTYVIGVLPSAMCMLIRDELHFPTDTYSIILINGHVLTAFATKTLGIFSGSRASGVLLTIIQYLGLVILMAAQYTLLKDINPGHRYS